MNCKHCGAILNEGEKFCRYCGKATESSDVQNSQPYQVTNATEWQQAPAQNQQNQQYQNTQQNQGQQQFQQPSQNQQKSKSGKTVLIIILCVIIIPIVLFFIILFGLGIFIYNSASDTVKSVSNSMTGTYGAYNWSYDSKGQSIEDSSSSISGLGNTVKLKDYTLTIPNTIEAKENSLNTQINLTSKDNTWMGQITTSTASYDTLKKQKEQASALLSKMTGGENATSSELQTENIGGVEYLISEISSSEGTGLLCYTKLSPTNTAIIVVYNSNGTTSRNALTEISNIIKSAQ